MQSRLGNYQILSRIGAGGMGEVWLAEDERLRRKIALKVLPDSLAQDAERLQRFEREALAVSALNHPNIVTIYQFGVDGTTHFLAAEYIDGETLRDRLKREPLSLREALEIAVQTGQALAAAHEAGIIHRDLKPENLMLRKDGIVKVLDFGLAKLIESSPLDGEAETRKQALTEAGTVMGTVAYMSPEQARGRTVDVRTDIFSLGVVLYEMLTSRQPFTGETISHVIVAILEHEPPPLPEGMPEELTRILKQMLAKDAANRYPTAQATLNDLRKLQKRLDYEAEFHADSPETSKVQPVAAPAATDTVQDAATSLAGSQPALAIGSSRIKLALASVVSLLVLAGGYLGYHLISERKGIESIAVLPFKNEIGNVDIEYLSDGMTETLIKGISGLPNLRVKPRSSVFRYKGKDTDIQTIARELDVQAILNGRVSQRGDQISLSLELVDVRQDKVIWSEVYHRKDSDLVSLQNEIAKDVSANLKAKLAGGETASISTTGTSDPEAYQAYLKGRFYWNRRTALNIGKALDEFRKATEKDPSYALAFVGLADCYAVMTEYAGTPGSENLPKAKAFAERALAIDPRLSEAHATLAAVAYQSGHWSQAEEEFKQVFSANSTYPTAYHWHSILLRTLGRYDDALAAIKRGQELDPLSSVISVNVTRCYQAMGNHQASIANSLKTIELDPNFGSAYQYLAISYAKLGKFDDAITNALKAVELTNRSSIALGDLGWIYAVAGKRDQALSQVNELQIRFAQKTAPGMYLAAIYAGLGEKDKAFEWIEKDFQTASADLAKMRWQPQFDSLKDDPRFTQHLRRLGLPGVG